MGVYSKYKSLLLCFPKNNQSTPSTLRFLHFCLWCAYTRMYVLYNAVCRSYIKKNTNTERTLVYIVWCKEKMTLNPTGTNCSLLLADLLLYSYEAKFLQKLVRKKLNHSLLPSNKHSGISTKHF